MSAPLGRRNAERQCPKGALPPTKNRVRLALRELEATASARLTVLLALDGAGVTGEHTGLLQRRTEVRVVLGESAGETVADGAGLAVEATTDDVHVEVDLAFHLEELKRLLQDQYGGLGGGFSANQNGFSEYGSWGGKAMDITYGMLDGAFIKVTFRGAGR